MITVTKEQLTAFAMEQPDDRKINFNNPKDEECGCLMVHYGQAQGWAFPQGCSFCSWISADWKEIARLLGYIDDIVPASEWGNITTYGQLKTYLKSKENL